jgi:hypothetical protein
VLFYHSDFSGQINLGSLGAAMALSGHTHASKDDFSYPYDIVTASTCDGKRSYRLVRVSRGVLQPSSTISAGSNGGGLSVDFAPANDGTSYSVTADIKNNFGMRFEHSRLRFLMPNVPGRVGATGGTLLQIDDSGLYAVCYVGVDISQFSPQTVTVTLDTSDTVAPTVTVTSPNGDEVWEIGSSHDITWTATDDIGVASVSIILSADGGSTYADMLATGEANDGVYSWLVGTDAVPTARIRVIAYDGSGKSGEDASDSDFEIRYVPAGIPPHLVITGASPNPFSRHAVIRFGLPRDGLVEIDLYDVSGHFVTNLVREEYSAGYHSVDWNDDGKVGTGLYFLRLRLGSETATCKAVIPR